MPIEADLKDFFAEPIKTPSQHNTVRCKTHFVDFLPRLKQYSDWCHKAIIKKSKNSTQLQKSSLNLN